jgi:hypothetical protein
MLVTARLFLMANHRWLLNSAVGEQCPEIGVCRNDNPILGRRTVEDHDIVCSMQFNRSDM